VDALTARAFTAARKRQAMTDDGTERSAFLDWGFASAALPGETTCGDVCVVRDLRDGALVAAVDGVGHGRPAADAALRAADALAAGEPGSIISLVRRCHDALTGTRGVVMSLALFDAGESTMTWISVGNVSGVLLRADRSAAPKQEDILFRGGIVGLRLPLLRATVVTVHPSDMLVFATDGIRPDFRRKLSAQLSPQELAHRILADYAKGTDDSLVLAARYRGGGPAAHVE
jgi:hypothetical protein